MIKDPSQYAGLKPEDALKTMRKMYGEAIEKHVEKALIDLGFSEQVARYNALVVSCDVERETGDEYIGMRSYFVSKTLEQEREAERREAAEKEREAVRRMLAERKKRNVRPEEE